MSKFSQRFVVVMILMLAGVQLLCGASAAIERQDPDAVWKEIVSLIDNKRPGEAFLLALRHEKDGDPRIWAFLGDCFSNGDPAAPDFTRAFELYRKAAKSVPYARYRMGAAYAVGRGVPCDKEKAWTLIDDLVTDGFRMNARQVREIQRLLQSSLSEYTDAALKIRFPTVSQKFELSGMSRYFPKKFLGYSLRYDGAGEWIDLYIYDGSRGNVPDGVSPQTLEMLRAAERDVQTMVKMGRYGNFRQRTENQRGILPSQKLDYTWFSFMYDKETEKNLRSVILIFGARGKFFKIRYSGTVEKDVPPEKLPTMVADFLNHLDAALGAETR